MDFQRSAYLPTSGKKGATIHVNLYDGRAQTLEITMLLRAEQRFAAIFAGQSSVQQSPLAGHKAPCSRPCCWGTRLAPLRGQSCPLREFYGGLPGQILNLVLFFDLF